MEQQSHTEISSANPAMKDVAQTISQRFSLEGSGQENCRVLYQEDPMMGILGKSDNENGGELLISGFVSKVGWLGEVRVDRRDPDEGGNVFLFVNTGDNYEGVYELGTVLQGMDIDVTEIMPHPSLVLTPEEEAKIKEFNDRLKEEWIARNKKK